MSLYELNITAADETDSDSTTEVTDDEHTDNETDAENV